MLVSSQGDSTSFKYYGLALHVYRQNDDEDRIFRANTAIYRVRTENDDTLFSMDDLKLALSNIRSGSGGSMESASKLLREVKDHGFVSSEDVLDICGRESQLSKIIRQEVRQGVAKNELRDSTTKRLHSSLFSLSLLRYFKTCHHYNFPFNSLHSSQLHANCMEQAPDKANRVKYKRLQKRIRDIDGPIDEFQCDGLVHIVKTRPKEEESDDDAEDEKKENDDESIKDPEPVPEESDDDELAMEDGAVLDAMAHVFDNSNDKDDSRASPGERQGERQRFARMST